MSTSGTLRRIGDNGGDTAQPPDWTARTEHTQQHDQQPVDSLDGTETAPYIAPAYNASISWCWRLGPEAD